MNNGQALVHTPSAPLNTGLEAFRIADAVTPNGLYPAEEQILVSITKGETCVISLGRPEEAAHDYRVRASFIRFLVTSDWNGIEVHERGLTVKGAYIEGDLDLMSCEVVRLSLKRCFFSGVINLRDSRVNNVILNGSRVSGIVAWGMKCDGSFLCRNDFLSEGEVDLSDSYINGSLDFRNSKIIASRFLNSKTASTRTEFAIKEEIGEPEPDRALTCIRTKVGGAVYLRDGFVSEGRTSFAHGEIGGFFSCKGSSFGKENRQALNCQNLEVRSYILLSEATFDGEVEFTGSTLGSHFRADGIHCKSKSGKLLKANYMVVRGDVTLIGANMENGRVNMANCDIRGNLICTGGTFKNPGSVAIYFRGANIKGELYLDSRFTDDSPEPTDVFTAEGLVDLRNATIGRNLNCQGGRFINSGKVAIFGAQINVQFHVFVRRQFYAEGEVNFHAAEIKGIFGCSGGRFVNKGAFRQRSSEEGDEHSARCVLNLTRAKINFLNFGPYASQKAPIFEGSVDLRDAEAATYEDHRDAWPKAPEDAMSKYLPEPALYLNGFTYNRFVGGSPLNVAARKEWLRRQPASHRKESFKPQPYEQLMKVLRVMGHEEEAFGIAYLKQRQVTVARVNRASWIRKPFIWLNRKIFSLTAGYGYRIHRLLIAAVVFWLAAAAFFWQAGEKGVIGPGNAIVYLDGTLKECEPNWVTCKHSKMLNEHTPFYPMLYSLDVMLPIVPLGQETAWSPMDKEWTLDVAGRSIKIAGWVGLTVMWIEVLFGWIVGLTLVAIFSGVVKRE